MLLQVCDVVRSAVMGDSEIAGVQARFAAVFTCIVLLLARIPKQVSV